MLHTRLVAPPAILGRRPALLFVVRPSCPQWRRPGLHSPREPAPSCLSGSTARLLLAQAEFERMIRFPATPLGICLASSAIRSIFVETVVGLEFPFIFPSNGSVPRQPLPSSGSVGRLSPIRRYYELLRLLGTR